MGEQEELNILVDADISKAESKLGTLKGLVGGLGLMSLGGFVKDSLDKWKEQEVVVSQLNAAVESHKKIVSDVGSTQDAISKHFQDQASALQKVTTFGDEQSLRGYENLTTFSLTGKEVDKLMIGVGDLVAHTDGLNANAQSFLGTTNMIGKGISTGQIAGWKKVGITVDEATIKLFQHANQSERVALASKILNENYGGYAKKLAQSQAGKEQQAWNDIGDKMEEIGKKLLPYVVKLTDMLNKNFDLVVKIGLGIAAWKIGKGVFSGLSNIKTSLSTIAEESTTQGSLGKMSMKSRLAGGALAGIGAGVATGSVGTGIGTGVGAVGGGALGGFLGSFLGPAGTIVGEQIGQFAGGAIGGWVGGTIEHGLNLDGKQVAKSTSHHNRMRGGNAHVAY